MPETKIPDDYRCPITRQIMVDPVSTSDGQTYEREAIEEWLRTKNTSPATGAKLTNKNLTPNIRLKSIISEFIDKNPQVYKDGEVYLKKGALKTVDEAIKKDRSQEVIAIVTKNDPTLLEKTTEDGYTIFHLICEFGSSSLFKEFMQKFNEKFELFAKQAQVPPGKWFSKWPKAELLEAAKSGDNSKIQLMLRLGAYINNTKTQNGYTALFLAMQADKFDTVRLLYKLGADINAEIDLTQEYYSSIAAGNYTPLLFLIETNKTEMFDVLLSLGADINHSNSAGLTPLHQAVKKNCKAIAWRLLLANAIVDAKSKTGVTPLMLAVDNNETLTRMLLERGANPNAEDFNGNRVIHIAARRSTVSVVRWLLHYDVDYAVRDRQGNTPDELAQSSEIRDLLVKKVLQTKESVLMPSTTQHRQMLDILRQQGEMLAQLQTALTEQTQKVDTLWQQTVYLTTQAQKTDKQLTELQERSVQSSVSLPFFAHSSTKTADDTQSVKATVPRSSQ